MSGAAAMLPYAAPPGLHHRPGDRTKKKGAKQGALLRSRRYCAYQNAIVAETTKRWSASFLLKFWLPFSSVS